MCCRYLFCLFTLKFCIGFLLCLVMRLMTGCGYFQVDQGQEREDQCLYKSDKQFKWDEDNISKKGQDEGKHGQHHASGKDVAKETEGQGEYAGKFTDEFNQSHKELNETLEHS